MGMDKEVFATHVTALFLPRTYNVKDTELKFCLVSPKKLSNLKTLV